MGWSLDSYKINLLYNKQFFINQLKKNTLGSRTIDEGAMDEDSGMNFSEYVAVLSGNTDPFGESQTRQDNHRSRNRAEKLSQRT